MSVYKAISEVQKELSEKGIGKAQYNEFDKYRFRGIDDVYNALGPVLARHGLVIYPEVKSRETIERTSQKGGMMLHVILDVTYHFIGDDGSEILVPVIGEAMDRGDKAINKAFSAAYKLACFQVFCIPVEGENRDSEQESPQIAPPKKSKSATAAALEGVKIDTAQRDAYVGAIMGALMSDDDAGLAEILDELSPDHEMKMAVWLELGSADRAAIKKFEAERRAAAA